MSSSEVLSAVAESATNDAGMSLEDRFSSICSDFYKLQSDESSLSFEEVEYLKKSIAQCSREVENAGLISKNEIVDDIPTSSLKFLQLDYILATVLNTTAPQLLLGPPSHPQSQVQSIAASERGSSSSSSRDTTTTTQTAIETDRRNRGALLSDALSSTRRRMNALLQAKSVFERFLRLSLQFEVLIDVSERNTLSMLFDELTTGSPTSATLDSDSMVGSSSVGADADSSYSGEVSYMRRSQKMKPEDRRNLKIMKFKRDRAAKERITEIKRKLYIRKKESNIRTSGSRDRVGGGREEEAEREGGGVESLDREEEERELVMLQLQMFTRQSVDDIDSINQELQLLAYREKHASDEGEGHGDIGGGGGDRGGGGFGSEPGRESKGLTVTKLHKVGDQILSRRETVKATVFQPRMAPPTMSLAEFGDLQLQEAQEREARQAEAEQSDDAPKKYRQLVEEGKEDNPDLVDKATEYDRHWDDWKDDNPKGWGNKMGKRF